MNSEKQTSVEQAPSNGTFALAPSTVPTRLLNQHLTVAFDVDGTLITYLDQPRWAVIQVLKFFVLRGAEVMVWSGGGAEYAEHWARKLFLPDKLISFSDKPRLILWSETAERVAEPIVDISFDDLDVNYGKVNIRV